MALDDHLVSTHMARWRAAWPEFEVTERRISAYEISAERVI
jgi:quinol monooxygenase YgiN